MGNVSRRILFYVNATRFSNNRFFNPYTDFNTIYSNGTSVYSFPLPSEVLLRMGGTMFLLPFIPSCVQKTSDEELLDVLSLLLSYLRLSVEIQIKAIEENLIIALSNLLRGLPVPMISVPVEWALNSRKS